MNPVALYFVASPLQYLAARRIAASFEAGSRQVLVWYKHGVASIVRPEEWDAASFMPWPRWEPLPGPCGRHRRLRANIRLVAQLVGRCDDIRIHSAVFDTEAINYFLRALPPACGARRMRARILPDGIISTRRYPLSLARRLAQYGRKLRRLAAPELDYWCFGGDRIGSDAPSATASTYCPACRTNTRRTRWRCYRRWSKRQSAAMRKRAGHAAPWSSASRSPASA